MAIGVSNQVMLARVPVEAGSWYAQANELMNNGNYDQAIQLYDKVIGTSPACAMAHHNKGNCLDQPGKIKRRGPVLRHGNRHRSLRCGKLV